MKTRNYKAVPAKTNSNRTGVGPYARLEAYATKAKEDFVSRLPKRQDRREERRVARTLDRARQQREKGTNWEMVRLLLDANKGMTLDMAKTLAGSIGELI